MHFYGLAQLQAGTAPVDIKLDTTAPYLKRLLAMAFAKALSELPSEKVRHCWAPLQAAYDDMEALHAKAAQDLARLFPNMQAPVPDGNEEERVPLAALGIVRGEGLVLLEITGDEGALLGRAMPMPMEPTAAPGGTRKRSALR